MVQLLTSTLPWTKINESGGINLDLRRRLLRGKHLEWWVFLRTELTGSLELKCIWRGGHYGLFDGWQCCTLWDCLGVIKALSLA